MDREHEEAEAPTVQAHTPEERAALHERVSEMVGYVNLLEAHDQALDEEMRAERERAQAAAPNEVEGILAASRVERGWRETRQPLWWAIGVLLIGIVLAVIAFIGGGSDATSSTSGSDGAAGAAAEEQADDEGASGAGAVGDEVDTGGAADAGDAASSAGDDSPAAPETADIEYLLDLASEVVAHAGAANAAVSADDKGAASEQFRAIKPLMTQYIEGGGDLVMHDFSEAQDAWLWAANSYVSGNTGALADMQAAYAVMVAALERYEGAAAKD